jgi:hypothetical protein
MKHEVIMIYYNANPFITPDCDYLHWVVFMTLKEMAETKRASSAMGGYVDFYGVDDGYNYMRLVS